MTDFQFSQEVTESENMDAFYVHLETLDPECAEILRAAVHHLSPLPSGAARTTARTRAYNEIKQRIDSLVAPGQ